MGRHSAFILLVLVAILVKGGTASRVGGVTADRTFNLRKLLTGQSCDAAADYALVLDSSGSLQATGYAQLKNAALQILSATTNAANRYYCNQFASSLDTIMTGWGNEATAQTALNSANWLASRTNMVAGLSDALAKLQQPSTNSVKLCFLITDGEPNEGGGPAAVAAVATSIKALAGVKLVTIGVGPSVNAAFLTSIASPGSYYPVGSTADLVAQIKDIVYRACPLVCEAPQQFTLSTTGESCTLPLCTPALVSSGAQCYSVYKSGSQNGIVTQTPDSITALAGGFTEQDIVAKSGSDQQCTGRVKLTCIKAECRYPSDCNSKLPDLMCATKVCNAGYCDYKPKMRGSSCNDTNPCTLYDKCDGSNIGEDACHGTDKSCATQLPPNPYYKSCYDTPYCDVNTGGCVWPYNSAALNSIISAHAYCGTWAGAFATQLVSNNTTPNPSGSTSYGDCFAACTADVCAKAVPACSCTATAGSSSRASAGTCPPCPMTIPDATWCAGMTCNAGQYTVPSDGSHPNATCWYPDPNVKNGAGGYLYPCAGSVFTEYSLTGGTSVSQCMGCLALGSAYDNKSSTCYAGQIAIPVDP